MARGLNKESEKREAKEQLATVSEGGYQRDRLQLATVGEIVTRLRWTERRPDGTMPRHSLRIEGCKSTKSCNWSLVVVIGFSDAFKNYFSAAGCFLKILSVGC